MPKDPPVLLYHKGVIMVNGLQYEKDFQKYFLLPRFVKQCLVKTVEETFQ